MWRAFASGSRANGQSSADAVRIANRIRHGEQADVFDIITGKQAEARGVRRICDGVKQIGHKDVIHINADLGIRSAHHAKLSQEIIVGGWGDTRESLQRTERIVGQDRCGLAEFAAGEGKVAHSGPVLWLKDIPAHLNAISETKVFGREIDGELLCVVRGGQLEGDLEGAIPDAARLEDIVPGRKLRKWNFPSSPVTVVVLVPTSAIWILASDSPPWALVTMPLMSAAKAGMATAREPRESKSALLQNCPRRDR